MKEFLVISSGLLFLMILSCQSSSHSAPTLVGFEIKDMPESASKWAIRYGDDQFILEQGPLLDGVPNGTWTAYDKEKSSPKSITSFIAGKKSGPYIEYGKKGEMKVYAEYYDDQLHGKRIEFGSIGRHLKEANYSKGVLEGEFKEWSTSGKLEKTMNYKNGKLDGPFAFYDQKGNKTAEYTYQNGNKVSGGVIAKEPDSTEK